MRKRLGIASLVVGCLLVIGSAVAVAGGTFDFGVRRDKDLASESNKLFGVKKPLEASSTQSITQAAALADPTKLATLAKGLTARVVTTQGPSVDDQISLWPNDDHPTHLIVCNEQDPSQPGLVRIELATGNVSTIVTGTNSCDPTRRTPWGTILFGEESGTNGQLYELIDPLHTTNVVLDRTTGVFSGGTGPANLVRRDALDGPRSRALGSSMTAPRSSIRTIPASGPRTVVRVTRTSSSFPPRRSRAVGRSRSCPSRRMSQARCTACGWG